MSTFQSIIVKGAYFCILINKIYFIIKVVKVILTSFDRITFSHK